MSDWLSVHSVNFLAVLVAAVSYMLVGSLWYSPLLFAKSWMKENGFTEEDLKGGLPLWLVFVLNFVFSFIAAFFIALIIGSSVCPASGAIVGAMVSILCISTARITDVLYERRSLKLFFIHAGFNCAGYMVMGAIIGVWQ